MKVQYFDIHSHVHFPDYDADREAVIQRAHDAGIAMISVGTDLEVSRKAVELAEKHENMYAAIGLHPTHSRDESIDMDAFKELASHPKTVAIGECGLDYYRLDEDSRQKQIEAFEKMIDIANEAGKPLMLHIRNSDRAASFQNINRSAYKDAYEILKSRAKVKGNLHFYAGSIEETKPFLELGYTFSFTGVLTFTHDYDEVVRYIPIDRIMSETDCPFVTPVPHRGKRNEPYFVIEVVKAIARIKDQPQADVAKQLLENAQKFIRI